MIYAGFLGLSFYYLKIGSGSQLVKALTNRGPDPQNIK
jgi:hypothetical protein